MNGNTTNISVLTQYKADGSNNNIFHVMDNNNSYPEYNHNSICRKRLLDMRKEVSEIKRHKWRQYLNELKEGEYEIRSRMMSYPHHHDNEMVDE